MARGDWIELGDLPEEIVEEARLYHHWVSERPATAPVLGLTAVLR